MSYNEDGLAFLSEGNLNQSVSLEAESSGSSYLTFPNELDTILFSGEFSLCCRVYLKDNNYSSLYPIFYMINSSSYSMNYILEYFSGNLRVIAEDSSGNLDALSSSLSLSLNSWISICARVTDGNMYLQDDSGSDSTATSYYPYRTDFANDLHVFKDGRSFINRFSYGQIEDIALYNYDIGAEGSQVYINGGIPGVPSLYVPLNEKTGTTASDLSRNSNDGTVNGSDYAWVTSGTVEDDKRLF